MITRLSRLKRRVRRLGAWLFCHELLSQIEDTIVSHAKEVIRRADGRGDERSESSFKIHFRYSSNPREFSIHVLDIKVRGLGIGQRAYERIERELSRGTRIQVSVMPEHQDPKWVALQGFLEKNAFKGNGAEMNYFSKTL